MLFLFQIFISITIFIFFLIRNRFFASLSICFLLFIEVFFNFLTFLTFLISIYFSFFSFIFLFFYFFILLFFYFYILFFFFFFPFLFFSFDFFSPTEVEGVWELQKRWKRWNCEFTNRHRRLKKTRLLDKVKVNELFTILLISVYFPFFVT